MGRLESRFGAIPWAMAAALLVGSGLIQGRLDGRWAAAEGLDAAVARIKMLPPEFGTWRGDEGDADEATLRRIGIGGGILRRYRDAASGEAATALLVCGRPGPVAVHTPDVCYKGSGYEIESGPAEEFPGFVGMTVARRGTPVTDRLQVLWSWNADGPWEAPANPRVRFGSRPYLYKLYLIRNVPNGPAGRSEAFDRFGRDLADRLGRDLRPPVH